MSVKKIYQGKSDKEGYKNMSIFSDGSKIYFNDLKTTDEMNRAFTACWDSLTPEQQRKVNQKVEEKRRAAKEAQENSLEEVCQI